MERLYCAVDTGDFDAATALVSQLIGVVGGIKLGSEFVINNGIRGVTAIGELGVPIMLDLKLLEIPRDVGNVIRVAAQSGAFLVTIHALGGGAMMRTAMAAALRAADESGARRMRVVAATLLTNIEDADIGALGMGGTVSAQVSRLTELAAQCGLDGVWTSAHELAALRAQCDRDFLLVVPGIRPVWSQSDDQTRIITPGDAVLGGADYLVVGRPITQADDPRAAAARIADEMAAASA